MPIVRPFRGIFYNANKVVLADVVAPPYDVISPEQQNELYRKDPFNVVRLILGREENRYQSAKKFFDEWRQSDVLIEDGKPCMYVLSQQFALQNRQTVTRRGFVAACRLEDFAKGSIFPHEKTLSKPKEDRFRLFLATGAMFSQIFSLYSDPQQELDAKMSIATNGQPDIDIEFESVRNRLWKVSDVGIVQPIVEFLRDKRVFVADGHHRYETALLFRDSMRLKHPNDSADAPYDFVPMFFTNMHDPGLVILPTHRFVHSLPDFNPSKFVEELKQFFDLISVESMNEMMNNLQHDES